MTEHIAQNWRMKKIRYSLQARSELTAKEVEMLHEMGLGTSQILEMTREQLMEISARLAAQQIPSAFHSFVKEMSFE
jgi:hypothetical protein